MVLINIKENLSLFIIIIFMMALLSKEYQNNRIIKINANILSIK